MALVNDKLVYLDDWYVALDVRNDAAGCEAAPLQHDGGDELGLRGLVGRAAGQILGVQSQQRGLILAYCHFMFLIFVESTGNKIIPNYYILMRRTCKNVFL